MGGRTRQDLEILTGCLPSFHIMSKFLLTLKTVGMGVLGAAIQAAATQAANPNGLTRSNITAAVIGGALTAVASYMVPSPIKKETDTNG